MADMLVDGKEIDDLTFTPAVNYQFNDDLFAHDESTFDERLYRTDFRGSKQVGSSPALPPKPHLSATVGTGATVSAISGTPRAR